MHEIEPYSRWLRYYDSSNDELSPFFGKEYNYELYSETIYNYYIDPAWDYMGSDTLYIKLLFVNYKQKVAILEFIGEWNDAITNDIMLLKRNVIDHLSSNGIQQFILIGESVFNFHGSDDCYYEEWFEDIENGWIVAMGFQDFILDEWKKYNLDYYINFGGKLEIDNWRTFTPMKLVELVNSIVIKRLEAH